eukprot:TRINITY_DN2314_c0_g1_i1.p1 TRINITY_DN2314_c0_g1~~TRINITY_DN2314_c0_g1_i1.p1  ORF type:complete len:518 (+),score=110.07 TRINITY_DN2314_c0_g1_i1:100-1653(+)
MPAAVRLHPSLQRHFGCDDSQVIYTARVISRYTSRGRRQRRVAIICAGASDDLLFVCDTDGTVRRVIALTRLLVAHLEGDQVLLQVNGEPSLLYAEVEGEARNDGMPEVLNTIVRLAQERGREVPIKGAGGRALADLAVWSKGPGYESPRKQLMAFAGQGADAMVSPTPTDSDVSQPGDCEPRPGSPLFDVRPSSADSGLPPPSQRRPGSPAPRLPASSSQGQVERAQQGGRSSPARSSAPSADHGRAGTPVLPQQSSWFAGREPEDHSTTASGGFRCASGGARAQVSPVAGPVVTAAEEAAVAQQQSGVTPQFPLDSPVAAAPHWLPRPEPSCYPPPPAGPPLSEQPVWARPQRSEARRPPAAESAGATEPSADPVAGPVESEREARDRLLHEETRAMVLELRGEFLEERLQRLRAKADGSPSSHASRRRRRAQAEEIRAAAAELVEAWGRVERYIAPQLRSSSGGCAAGSQPPRSLTADPKQSLAELVAMRRKGTRGLEPTIAWMLATYADPTTA